MIAHGIPIFVALKPVGMRLGAERLGLNPRAYDAHPRSRDVGFTQRILISFGRQVTTSGSMVAAL